MSEEEEEELNLTIRESEVQQVVLEEEVEFKLNLTPHSNKKSKRKLGGETSLLSERAAKRAARLVSRPSYGITLGAKKPRAENRGGLSRLLEHFMSQSRWSEACGVLSTLSKATANHTCPIANRVKFTALMEVMARVGGEDFNYGMIKEIYQIWIKKISSSKSLQGHNIFSVHMEFIIFCLNHGNLKDAHQIALWLMQERDFGKNPAENMVVGRTFYELWFSTIPKDMLRSEDDTESVNSQSWDLVAFSEKCNGSEMSIASTNFLCDSATSVRNDKSFLPGNRRVEIVKLEHAFEADPIQAVTPEISGQWTSASEHDNVSPYDATSLFSLQKMSSSLFPIRLSQSLEEIGDLYHRHMKLLNDYYKEALKHLRAAVCSTRPELDAVLPFIQLLLVGGKVGEALSELEKLCRNSFATLPRRLRAMILDHVDHGNTALLSTCFEDILKSDPSCCYAAEKLITMNKKGVYSNNSLLETLATRLDSTYPSDETWKELASCFSNILASDEDCISLCLEGKKDKRVQVYSVLPVTLPPVFTEGYSRENWRLRCQSWLHRHFNRNLLASDIATGDLKLSAHKAACASHMFGPENAYVVGVYDSLVKQNITDLMLYLKHNMEKSIQVYSGLKVKTNEQMLKCDSC